VAGAGIGLALSTDIRVATKETRCHFAFPTLGVIPDAGSSYLLPNIVGYHRAMEFYIRNEPLDAETGLAWGLYHEVVDKETVPERLAFWKNKMAALALKGFKLSKELFRQAMHRSIKDQVDAEYFAQLTAMKSEHFYRKVTELTTKKNG
jgi:2-(1,2-epoxy-1,2-dihydrophenyl)acetyl-CoA isomerase